MRVIVTGSRDYDPNNQTVARKLDAIHAIEPITDLAHGAARGVDYAADIWAKSVGIVPVRFEADWDAHDLAAGPIRNTQMIREFKPDAVIAFPGNRGTADCVKKARSNGIRVIEQDFNP